MKELLQYIISFLVGKENEPLVPLVSYGDNGTAPVVIVPSVFFNEGVYLTEKSLPVLPLAEIEGVPILFGTPTIYEKSGRIFVEADIVASAFFLLSRYEECVRRSIRDQHGRFPGRESLPYRAGFLQRPVVEEYGILLRKFLRRAGVKVIEPPAGFRHIWLTHDVDQIWTWDNYYRALRSTIKRIITCQPEKFRPILSVQNYQKYDPVYTFQWLKEQDENTRICLGAMRCTPVYFLMSCVNRTSHDIGYFSNFQRTQQLIQEISGCGREIGYHVSYAAGMTTSQVKLEIDRLQKVLNHPVKLTRNHYLASREPEDFYSLMEAGLTDDFTMGYADVAGFRLGTCRPVLWLDPLKRTVMPLTLHPMTVMECTLDFPGYMDIQDKEMALAVVKKLLDAIYKLGGEAVLLWHNPSVYPSRGSYQRWLYQQVLQYICEK